MSNRTADIHQLLASEDAEFREWIEEHHRCEDRLQELTVKSQVTIEEEIEEKTLKKRKLQLKDLMAHRIRAFDSQNAVA